MQAKLTLRLENHLISDAKSYAKHHGKSLSQLVAEYFRSLSTTSTFPLSGTAYRYDRSFEPATPVEDWEVASSSSIDEERKIIDSIFARRSQRVPVSTEYLQQLREEGRP